MTAILNPIAAPRVRRQAPGPRGNWLMGNLAAYKRDPIAMLLRLRQEHGDVARNRLGPFLTHALAHPEQLQYVLQDNHRNYVRGRFYDNFKLFFGNGLLTTDGDFWRRHRRAVQPMFHKKHINDSTAAVGAAAMGLVERWSRLAPGESIDVVPEMMHLSLAILGKMIFNSDISRHAEEVGPLVRFGLEAMMPQGNLNDFIPRSAPTPFNLRVHRARKGIDRIIAQVIDDHREGRCETSDIISLLLGARHPETGAPMTEREVHDEVMTVFLAGHETTGSGLAWALYAVAQHPSIFRQLREELDARLGGRTPTVADLEDLPYLDKVVNEALRVYPPIWGFTRDLSNDDEIGGFHIPAGSSIFIAPYVTHRHPEFWSNPEAFDPENFAADAPQRHKFAYLPFGGGMRKCIGYQMALLIMRVQIATVVQHLDLALLPGHPVIRGALISLRPLEGIRLVITPRARSAARSQEALLESSGVAKMERRGDGRAACPFDAAEPTPPTEAARKPEPDLGVGGAPPQPALAPKGLPSIDFAASRLSPGSEQGAAGDAPTLRFTWFPVEIDAPPAWPAPELAGKRIVIVNGERSAAERTALLLTRACAHAHVFAPAPGADVAAAASALAQQAGPFDGIVDLGLTAPFSLQGAADWEAPIRRTLGLLHACYADWSVEESASRLFYLAVTRIDGCMGYGSAAEEDEPMDEQPLGGIWAGLAKTLPQELPNCNVRILDLAPDEADAVDQRVVAELYRWGLFEVGYRGGRRYTLQAGRDDLLPQALPLAPGDAVLFSGGARGIGLLCAQAIAEHCGADVIVTGREEPPRGDEPWAILDEAGFKDYAKEQFRLTAPDRSLAEVRREMSRLRRRRELRVVLDDLARRNLPVHYRVCDVTDEAAVRELCAEFGDRLRVIIHNAGVDQPVRLGQKSVESFIGVVRTKVLGFAHLCAAAKECGNLLHFCNVGSLTGRCGGMTGETDYAAANEALARLGLWASRRALKCAVKTLAWPTWDQVGMIANFDVTKRYVSPMTIDEGLRHWLAELSDARSGEVMFMGAAGAAVTPIQIKGFNPIFGLPNLDRLVTRHHHAGEPRHFRPFARLATRYRLDQASARFLHAYRLDDRPALPAALLIEHAVGIGSWVMPEGLLSLELAALTDIAMPLDAAILPSLGEVSVELLSEATGYWRDADWMVDVRCVIAATRQEALRLTLTHRDRPSAAAASTIALSASTFDAAEPHDLPAPRRALWRGHVLRAAEWRRVQDGASSLYIGEAAPAHAADLWALPHPPQLRLPVNHLENALRAAWAEHSGAAEAELTEWRIEAIALGAAPAASARFVVRHGGGRFTIADGDGVIVMELNGLALRAHAADRSAAARDETRPAMAAAI